MVLGSVKDKITKEYLRQSQIKNKNGVRLFNDEYLVNSFSLAFSISKEKVKNILHLQSSPNELKNSYGKNQTL